MKFNAQHSIQNAFRMTSQQQSQQAKIIPAKHQISHNHLKIHEKKSCIRWTKGQKVLYLRFLKSYSKMFDNNTPKSKAKKCKKLKKMASFIESKNSNQCRSHHQKMILKYISRQNIIKQLSAQASFNTLQVQFTNTEINQTLEFNNEVNQNEINQNEDQSNGISMNGLKAKQDFQSDQLMSRDVSGPEQTIFHLLQL